MPHKGVPKQHTAQTRDQDDTRKNRIGIKLIF